MVGKLSLLMGLGAGYVLGARSGRERYDQIVAKAQELWRTAPASGSSNTSETPGGGRLP